ncbi:MAG: hypothetical protein CMN30_00470 [Sandaracinus sp.]|nr:hypothetical protein [Sandaracinus sp.]|tara:strand:+ start:2889 stop:3107 length:219 start_codon:yes stop_codon:yes gene_type:complete
MHPRTLALLVPLLLTGCPKSGVPTDDAAEEVVDAEGGEEVGSEGGLDTISDPPPEGTPPGSTPPSSTPPTTP